MGLSIWQIAIIAVVALILFGGGGKLVRLMGDMGSGLRAFKKGIADEGSSEGKDDTQEPAQIAEESEPTPAPKKSKAKKSTANKSKSKKSKAKKSTAKKSKAKKS